MSARKVGNADLFQPVTVQARATSLSLSAGDIRIRKNGIEFRTTTTIPVWTEMTMELETPFKPKKLNCTGVVVACTGNRHAGFVVSMVFTHLSRQTQARLNSMTFSR
jgi:hypothetical protein